MNMTPEVHEFLTENLDGFTTNHLQSYNKDFNLCCAMLRETNEILVKEEYTDEELLKYTLKTMAMMIESKNEAAYIIRHLLYEGWLEMDCCGTLSVSEFEPFELTDDDFLNVKE